MASYNMDDLLFSYILDIPTIIKVMKKLLKTDT